MTNAKRLRLDRLLSNLGYGSRKEVTAMLSRGRVQLDGAVIKDGDEKMPVEESIRTRLTVDGEGLDHLPGLLILMHKPVGYTCSRKEEEGDLVYNLLPERWKARDPAVATVGRLDKDTSGVLLLTDDGALLHKIAGPKHKVIKRYRAKLARPLTGKEGAIFAAGDLMLEDEHKPLLPARLEVVGPKEAVLEISEGRYHQVRRMFAAVGNHVNELHRESVGGIELPKDLAPGEYRLLDPSEAAKIFA